MSEKIRGWKPWEKSTGPRTEEGKAAACRNRTIHGLRGEVGKELSAALREFRQFLRGITDG